MPLPCICDRSEPPPPGRLVSYATPMGSSTLAICSIAPRASGLTLALMRHTLPEPKSDSVPSWCLPASAACLSAYARPPHKPISSLAKAMTRMVRSGRCGRSWISLPGAMAMAQAAPASMAAGPGGPGVGCPADGDDLVGMLLAGDFSDHVGAGVAAIEAYVEVELDAYRLAI